MEDPHKEYKREYNRLYQQYYRSTPEGLEKVKASLKKYQSGPKYKARKREYYLRRKNKLKEEYDE